MTKSREIDAQIADSWEANAAAWTEAVRGREIQSRVIALQPLSLVLVCEPAAA